MNYTPLPSFQNSRSHHFLFAAAALLTVFLTVSLFFVLILEPRIEEVHYSQNLLKYTPKINTSLSAVSGSLSDIFALISNNAPTPSSDKLLLRLDTRQFVSQLGQIGKPTGKGTVAGASSRIVSYAGLDGDPDELSALLTHVKGNTDFGELDSDVLGAESPEPDIILALRRLKDASLVAQKLSTEGLANLNSLRSAMSQGKPSRQAHELDPIISAMEKNNADSSHYFDQAKKTAHYYAQIMDIRIEFTPLLASYVTLLQSVSQSATPSLYLDRLDELATTTTALNNKIEAIKTEDLPDEMQPLHDDNVKTIGLINDSMTEVRQAITTNDFPAYVKAVLTLEQSLEPLSTRAVTLEFNFWQNNSIMKDADAIQSSYKDQEKALQSVVDKNRLVL